MNKCPILYTPCDELRYSSEGLRRLSPKLHSLIDLDFTSQELRQEAVKRATKMSIQGVQPKLSMRLSPSEQRFVIVDTKGTFILKPQSNTYSQLPENEDVSMKMARVAGIDVPLTGLIYGKDNELNYFIKRFDRYAKIKKYHVEDFAQLTEQNRETKYKSSMEKLIPVIERFCTFPLLEKTKLFRRVLFSFIIGNEDMHLKNFTLITKNRKISLSPAYDLLNTTIAIGNTQEEIALPIAGKKRNLTSNLLLNYYGAQRLGLTEKSIQHELNKLLKKRSSFEELIQSSFLSPNLKSAYLDILSERFRRLI